MREEANERSPSPTRRIDSWGWNGIVGFICGWWVCLFGWFVVEVDGFDLLIPCGLEDLWDCGFGRFGALEASLRRWDLPIVATGNGWGRWSFWFCGLAIWCRSHARKKIYV